MIVGVGIDILPVARMDAELRDTEGSVRDELFTESEIAYCESMRYPARHFAARFAAKEAALKALGGVGDSLPHWRDVEIEANRCGVPRMRLRGQFREAAERKRVDTIHVSLTHTAELAAATVVMECRALDLPREVNE
jgi:holo-[acyl-carrier protein] synthase